MKKSWIKRITTALTCLGICALSSCVAEQTQTPPPEPTVATVTFEQDGQTPIQIQVQIGCGVGEVNAPVQPDDQTLITEWNIAEGYLVKGDCTIEAITYTQGLSFGEATYFGNVPYATVSGYSGTGTNIMIPAYYRGKPVGRIDKEVFRGNKKITAVSLPEGLIEIEYYAFAGCANVTQMNIPSTLTILGENAISDADVAGKIYFPKVAEIPKQVLFGSKITELILPEGVLSIGENTFGGVSTMKKVILPKSIKEIHGLAFWKQPLEAVFYMGDEYDFWNVAISSDVYKEFNFGEWIENGRIPFYYYSETQPTQDGNFWHYVDGEAVIWE